jgi:hypothetical protein
LLNQSLASAHLPPVERKSEAAVEPGTAREADTGDEEEGE